MALYKRKGIWWIDISHQGQRIRRSAETSVKEEAKRLHDKLKADLWNQRHLKEIPRKTWCDAVTRWLQESTHKRSLETDKVHLRWIDSYLNDKYLDEIDNNLIENIACHKENTGVAPATVNNLLAIVRAILFKAKKHWGWLRETPTVRMRKVDNKRVRWLTVEEAQQLLDELPDHLRDMATFTLATGLRDSNVSQLRWEDVDMGRYHAFISAEKSKSKKAISVPLNEKALSVLKKRAGVHPTYVFTFRGKPITRCNNHSWRKALTHVGISDFRWHDLRHTWASWHIQSGTSLHELQVLGGWSTYDMVLRYAHLSSSHLQSAARRINVTNLAQLRDV